MTPKKFDLSRVVRLEPPDSKITLGSKLETVPPGATKNRPYIDYRYLITDERCEYCFTQERFPPEDYRQYFVRVREYSRTPVCDLMSRERDDNFDINDKWNTEMFEVIKTATGIDREWTPEMTPYWGHFHLYDKDDRPTDRPPPVVHFFYTDGEAFLMACYDRNHKIHPGIGEG